MEVIKVKALTLIQLLLCANFADLDVNFIRGRPTFASSSWCDGSGHSCGPQLAVDGNYDTLFNHYSCFSTSLAASGPLNWWAVDMGQLVTVDQVIVTNRGADANSNTRMDNFTVGLMNVTPSLTTVIRGNYSLCGVYPGHIPSGFNASVRCLPGSPPARYLIVDRSPTATEAINFCEVEVWPKHTVSQWKRESGVRLEHYVNATASVFSALDCMVLCQEAGYRCDSFNHNPIDNICELNRNSTGFSPLEKIVSSAWNWWTTFY